MKKNCAIGIVFMLLTFITFNIIFFKDSTTNYYKMINIGNGKNSSNIIVNSKNKNQNELYSIFKIYLNKYDANLCCSDISNTKYTQYVYLANNEFLKGIKLTKGSFLNPSNNESLKFLSTEDTSNKQQIGQISDFSGNNNFEIHTLKSYKTNNLFQKILKVQFENKLDINKFISDLSKCGIEVQKKQETNSEPNIPNFIIIIIVGCSYLLLMLLIFYSILNSYKEIAIEKMLGYKNSMIWAKMILPIIFIEVVCMFIVTSIMIIIRFNIYNQYFFIFLFKLCKIYALMIIGSIISLTLPFFYVRKISISNMLKNKKM